MAVPELTGEAREIVGGALTAALSGAELTRRLLAFASNQPLQPETIDVDAIVGGITRLLKPTLGPDIKISIHLEGGVWPVMADAAQLEASLTNLANNARDAMPRGGRLTFTTRNCHLDADYAAAHPGTKPGDYAMIEVGDDGAGMPPETMARIFDPFFTTKNRGNGTGLGLSMVFGFIKQSGGHINVYSEEGLGTTFRIYLPRTDEIIPEAVRAAIAAPVTGRLETILVVEDNAALRATVKRQLANLHYIVHEADGAPAALDLLATHKIDLLFTDVVMPGGMTGFELARSAVALYPSLKVLVTSGFPEMKLDVRGQAPAGVRLLTKPYRKDDLARTLRELLGD
jgi:CheY-like chemotaxis protein